MRREENNKEQQLQLQDSALLFLVQGICICLLIEIKANKIRYLDEEGEREKGVHK